MMKAFAAVVAVCGLVVICSAAASAQFKDRGSADQSVHDALFHPPSSSDWFGFFNPENFTMRQSYSMSYSSIGGQGIALGRYTNSMMYKFSNSLDARVDVSLQHSPYSTLGSSFQNSLNGIYLDRAQLDYRPSDKILLQLSYQQIPWGYYGFYSPYRGLFSGIDGYEGN